MGVHPILVRACSTPVALASERGSLTHHVAYVVEADGRAAMASTSWSAASAWGQVSIERGVRHLICHPTAECDAFIGGWPGSREKRLDGDLVLKGQRIRLRRTPRSFDAEPPPEVALRRQLTQPSPPEVALRRRLTQPPPPEVALRRQLTQPSPPEVGSRKTAACGSSTARCATRRRAPSSDRRRNRTSRGHPHTADTRRRPARDQAPRSPAVLSP